MSATRSPSGSTATNRRLLPLLSCVLIVMVGVGITLPVLPLYIERLALGAGASPRRVAMHVGLLTAAYPLTQLLFAPLWGRISDQVGRRPLIILGIVGFAASQLMFGIADGLTLLYAARLLGGSLSSALLPVASAQIVDLVSPDHRVRGMVSLNTAVGVGTIVGPAIGGFLSSVDVHGRVWGELVHVDGFSIPFFVATGLAIAALIFEIVRPADGDAPRSAPETIPEISMPRSLRQLLSAAAIGYLAITMFEATFALFAVARGFPTSEVGAAFTVCGGTMLLMQLSAVGLIEKQGERRTIAIGFGLMSFGMIVLVVATARRFVYPAIGILGAGMALLGPSLAAALSRRGARHVGGTMGFQQSAQSVGQIAGSVVGVLLFDWSARAPYITGAVILMTAGLALYRRVE